MGLVVRELQRLTGPPWETPCLPGQAFRVPHTDHGTGPSVVSLPLSSPHSAPNYRSERVTPLFKTLQCLHFMFWSVIHFEAIFVK